MTVLTDSNVRAIGSAEGRKTKLAAQVVSSMPTEYDWSARGAIAEAIRTAGGWTKDTCPARKMGGKADARATVFGVGFQALEDAVRALVKKTSDTVPGIIHMSLSGEGGGSVTLKPGDAGYEAAVLLLSGGFNESSDTAGGVTLYPIDEH